MLEYFYVFAEGKRVEFALIFVLYKFGRGDVLLISLRLSVVVWGFTFFLRIVVFVR